jgi:serine/threonine protein phosphatase PrpC
LILSKCSENLDLCCSQLIQSSIDQGGRDNVSVILVRVIATAASAAPANDGFLLNGWRRFSTWFKSCRFVKE